VNRRGELIDAQDGSQLDELPIFVGPGDSVEMLAKRFQSMSQPLAEMGLGISTLSISERRAWRVTLNNGLQLLLGRATSDAQLVRFSGVYKKELAKKVGLIQSVDLRYTNGFAVRWKAELG